MDLLHNEFNKYSSRNFLHLQINSISSESDFQHSYFVVVVGLKPKKSRVNYLSCEGRIALKNVINFINAFLKEWNSLKKSKFALKLLLGTLQAPEPPTYPQTS